MTDSQSGAQPDPGTGGFRGYPAYVLLLLAMANLLNSVDRNLVALLAELIKRDLLLSDTALGVLNGTAYAGAFLLAGIPIARWADCGNRRTILALGIGFWSLMTAAFGLGTGFWMLFIARVGVGIGEAAAVPTSMSLIGDYFSAERRGRAVSIFQLAAFLGLISMAVTGVIAQREGWRAPFVLAGAMGVVLAFVLFFTLVEPRSGRPRSAPAAASRSLLVSSRMLMSSRVYVLILVGVAAGAVSAASLSTWASAFLIRIHGLSVVEAAGAVGPASGIGGFLGTLLGGYATSWMVKRTGNRRWSLIIPGIALLLAVPAVLVFLFGDDPSLAIAMFGLQAFLWAIKTGPCYALALGLMPTELRAFAVSVLIVVGGVVGTGLGPPFVGFMSDTLGSGDNIMTLQLALIVAPAALLVAGVALLAAARLLK